MNSPAISTRRMRRIALTGGIATGKSHVLAQFTRAGVPTLDTDDLAHAAVAIGMPALSEVVARFGPSVLGPDGALDRRAMAAVIFSDAQARRDLEGIVLPRVREATEQWLTAMATQQHPFVVVAVPLLFEVGRDKDFEAVIVTTCAADAQRGPGRDRDLQRGRRHGSLPEAPYRAPGLKRRTRRRPTSFVRRPRPRPLRRPRSPR